jgi:energy-coupling factor transporter ATP-binding protein EcfA2
VSQPTWGVDVGAAAQIRGEILALRDAGCAVLVVSEELDELFEICDRLHVIAKGRLSPSSTARAGDGDADRRVDERPVALAQAAALTPALSPRGRGSKTRRRMFKLEPRPSRPLLELRLAAAGAADHRADRRGCCSPRWARTRCGPAGVLLGADQERLPPSAS